MRCGARTAGAAAVALAAFVLGGCGSGDSSSVAQDTAPTTPSSSASSQGPSGPACGDVWQKGHQLPRSYRGCVTDSGGYVKAEVYQCSDGHRLITYAHAFWAVPGRTISRAATTLAKDDGFQHTMAVCGA